MKRPCVIFEDPLALVGDKQLFGFEELLAKKFASEEPTINMGRGPVCRFFTKGFCIKGQSCVNRHQRNDRAVVCKHWLRGLCKKGEECEFLHEYDMAKMPECYFFTQYGECSNEDCLYLHITNQERELVCPAYRRGFCRHGNSCRNRHEARVLCPNYALGFCPNGPNCDFGHPDFDDGAVRNMACHTCGKPGHRSYDCPLNADKPGGGGGGGGGGFSGAGVGGERKVFTCYNCNGVGHSARECAMAPRSGGRGGPPRK